MFNLSSANAFSLVTSTILSFGNRLNMLWLSHMFVFDGLKNHYFGLYNYSTLANKAFEKYGFPQTWKKDCLE